MSIFFIKYYFNVVFVDLSQNMTPPTSCPTLFAQLWVTASVRKSLERLLRLRDPWR